MKLSKNSFYKSWAPKLIFFNDFFKKDSDNFWHWKRTLKVRILQSLTRRFIILVSLTNTWFSEEMLISARCICGLLPNLLIKSLTVSGPDQFPLPLVEEGFFGFLWEFSTLQIRVFLLSVNITGFPYHTACMSFWMIKRQAISKMHSRHARSL